MNREQRFAVSALGAIAAITVAWWALALWPVAPGSADWLVRTRAVCFGSTETGLPSAEGWALLIGQPLGMTLVLLVGWGRATREGLRRIAGSTPGRVLLIGVVGVLLASTVAASARVLEASSAAGPIFTMPTAPPPSYPRLDRAAPTPLALVDQVGDPFDLAMYRGRPVLVTFAFAHCQTVCPVLVREVLQAQTLSGEGIVPDAGRPAVVVVTVDPWRDTPTRLAHIARQWDLPPDGHVLSGDVDRVLSELEAWGVPIGRDSLTGDVTHPGLVYVLDGGGRIAFAATGGGRFVAELVGRL